MKKIAIVDGFSSGKFIAKELHNMGCKLVHISSRSDLDNYYYNGFDYSVYNEHIVHEQMESTLNFIKNFGADCIIAGAESGVLLTDQLNQHLEFAYANELSKSTARRNKYEMIESLRIGNIKAASQGLFSTWSEASDWLKKQLYPVVLKPVDSAGSDGVFICNSVSEAHEAFKQICKKINKLNNINEYVLFQQFLHGTEYVVNFVSLNNDILVTEVVKYHKKKLETGNVLYDIDEIIDASYPEFNELVDYTKQACKILGIKNGPSHAEVMLTEDGPCLVEIAARSDGILRPDVSTLTTGMGQIMATAISLTDRHFFHSLTSKPYYQLLNHSFNVGLINQGNGIFKSQKFVDDLKKLKSFHRVEFYIDENATLEKTTNVFNQPGTVYLISDSKIQLLRDYEVIRELEASHTYNSRD